MILILHHHVDSAASVASVSLHGLHEVSPMLSPIDVPSADQTKRLGLQITIGPANNAFAIILWSNISYANITTISPLIITRHDFMLFINKIDSTDHP
uniref:Uncharacterized protein n=1 Tax=Onchocerca volvulus TaxID=6282 RepID=A0A8R1Y0J3_ONCVO